MADDDIRNFINQQAGKLPAQTPLRRVVKRSKRPEPNEGYEDFSATHLFCPKCRQATPVRQKLLLYLPDGDLFDYVCTICGTSVGSKKG